MNKSLHTLLRLEGLTLTRKGLELVDPGDGKSQLADLDKEIQKVRRQLPPAVLSLYDRLAQRYGDPLSLLADGVCQGCRQNVTRPRVVPTNCSHEIFQCEHCGRFVFTGKQAPDYVT